MNNNNTDLSYIEVYVKNKNPHKSYTNNIRKICVRFFEDFCSLYSDGARWLSSYEGQVYP